MVLEISTTVPGFPIIVTGLVISNWSILILQGGSCITSPLYALLILLCKSNDAFSSIPSASSLSYITIRLSWIADSSGPWWCLSILSRKLLIDRSPPRPMTLFYGWSLTCGITSQSSCSNLWWLCSESWWMLALSTCITEVCRFYLVKRLLLAWRACFATFIT